jgi:crossover junction endodeoxyribonuclease RuvC
VVGSGRASKDQIGRMVSLKLGLTEVPRPDDVTDALAVALTHCEMHRGSLP